MKITLPLDSIWERCSISIFNLMKLSNVLQSCYSNSNFQISLKFTLREELYTKTWAIISLQLKTLTTLFSKSQHLMDSTIEVSQNWCPKITSMLRRIWTKLLNSKEQIQMEEFLMDLENVSILLKNTIEL